MTVHTFDIVLDSIRGFKSVVSRSLIVKPMKSAIYICPITQNQIILDSCEIALKALQFITSRILLLTDIYQIDTVFIREQTIFKLNHKFEYNYLNSLFSDFNFHESLFLSTSGNSYIRSHTFNCISLN